MPSAGSDESNHLAWTVMLSGLLALTVVPLDTLLGLVALRRQNDSPGQAELDVILSAGLLLIPICFSAFIVASLVLQFVCRRVGWRSRRATFLLAASPFVLLLVIPVVLPQYGFKPATLLAASFALGAAVLIGLGAGAWRGDSPLVRRIAWIFPSASLSLLAFVFLRMRAGVVPVGLAPTGLIWLVLLTSVLVGYRLSEMDSCRPAGQAAFSVVIGLGILGLFLVPQRTHSSQLAMGPSAGKRNVLLISVDSFRRDRLGAYGADAPKTPNIDRLATEGIVFDNAYSPAPWTFPGVVAFTAGINPSSIGFHCSSCMLSDDAVTIAEQFQDAGYRTAAFGDNPHISPKGLLQGLAEHRFGPHVPVPIGSPGGAFMRVSFPAWFGRVETTNSLTDNAIDWLERNKSARFFLWVHYLDPHIPYDVAPSDLTAYPEAGEVMRVSWALPRRVRDGEVLPPSWVETIEALYDAEAAEVDAGIGRLLDRLRDLGLYGETVVLLTSDHGEELWDHGSYEHGHSLHEELLRVPLVLKAPDLAPGRVAVRVATTQVPRTLATAAGLQLGDSDLPPQLPDAESALSTPDASVLIGATLYSVDQTGVIFDRYKYVRDTGTGAESLFDVVADSKQERPLDDGDLLEAARRELKQAWESAAKSLPLLYNDNLKPQAIPPDLLRSLGYL